MLEESRNNVNQEGIDSKEEWSAERVEKAEPQDEETPEAPEAPEVPEVPCKVTFSIDATEAYVQVDAPAGKAVPVKAILDALVGEKVTIGVDKQAVLRLASSRGERGKPVLVARGRPPTHGEDAKITYLFDVDPQPKAKPVKGGRVDYHETGVLQVVEAGDLLAVKEPPTEGKPGITVTGIPITQKPGKDIFLKEGPNTRFEDPQRFRLVSTIAGSAKLRPNGDVEVSDVFVVKGHVDYDTGNIRFDGHVKVLGDVKSGFAVAATKDIEINGVVEDAEIHCGGNLLVRGGFIGTGKGTARVAGETHIRFLENQNVIGNHDVHIAEEIIHANVICGGTVFVKYGKGAIIGGEIHAGRGIEAKTLGNIHYLKTDLEVGQHKVMDEWIKEIDFFLDHKEEFHGKLEDAVASFVQRKYQWGGLKEEESKLYDHLQQAMVDFDEWFEFLKKSHEKLLGERHKLGKKAYVKAEEKAYPGVRITIDLTRMKLDQEYEYILFRLQDGVITPFSVRGG